MLKLLGAPSESLADQSKNIATAFVFKLAWYSLMMSFVRFLATDQVGEVPVELEFFMACIWAPIWEETVFRLGPLKLAEALGEKTLVPIIIISSAVFGWLHGNGPFSVMLQGVSGVVYCLLFLKHGNIWSCMILHSMWNTYVMFII